MSNDLEAAGKLLDDLNGAGAPKLSDARRFAMLEQIAWHHHRHLRSHPAHPPSPALNEVPDPVTGEPLTVVENAGEASDEGLTCPSCGRNPANLEGSCQHCPATDKELETAEMNSYESGIDPWLRQRKIRRALYDLGKKHRASADAATVAAWRPVSDKSHPGRCLVYVPDTGIHTAGYNFEEGEWSRRGVTHWMRMPPEPRGGK